MKEELSQEVLAALAALASAVGGATEFHVTQPLICDHCTNPEVEAFPYHVYDKYGFFREDLCNGCFEWLGCSYPDDEVTK